MKIKSCRLSKQLDSVTENPFVFCGYKVSRVIGQNTHSRKIFSVHGFLNLSVTYDNEYETKENENWTKDKIELQHTAISIKALSLRDKTES